MGAARDRAGDAAVRPTRSHPRLHRTPHHGASGKSIRGQSWLAPLHDPELICSRPGALFNCGQLALAAAHLRGQVVDFGLNCRNALNTLLTCAPQLLKGFLEAGKTVGDLRTRVAG